MNQIRVNKAALLEALRSNRDEHRSIYEKAVEAYRIKAAELAREQAELMLRVLLRDWQSDVDGLDLSPDLDGPFVVVLEWDLGEEYELSEQDFSQYVMNDWGWARAFAANSMSYLAH